MKTTLFPWGFPTDNWLKDNYTFSSEYDAGVMANIVLRNKEI